MGYDPSYDIRQPAERPLISGGKAFPLPGAPANPPFAAGKIVSPIRYALGGGQKLPVQQQSFPCQQVTIVNEGGGDLVYGFNGVNLNTPTSGSPASNAFEIPNGAGKQILVSDAVNIWIGSVAGTLVSVEITGLSYTVNPSNPDAIPSPYSSGR